MGNPRAPILSQKKGVYSGLYAILVGLDMVSYSVMVEVVDESKGYISVFSF